VLDVFALLSIAYFYCLLGLFKHYNFELKLTINFLKVAPLRLELLQFGLVLFNHSLFEGLILLIQFKSLLFVDS